MPRVRDFVVPIALSSGCVKDWVYERLPGEVVGELATPSGLTSLSANTCGSCHTDIFAEWRQSGMANAWVDPVFQADFEHEHSTYVCRNCHTPLQQQRPEIIHGLSSLKPVTGAGVPNPGYDEALRNEGVTCAACHVREGKVQGSLAGLNPPHAVAIDAQFGQSTLCASCHQEDGPPFSSMKRPIADVVSEWRQWQATTGRTEECKDCHMPEVERPLTAWTPARTSGSHRFPGAWDNAFVRSAIRLDGVARTETGVDITLTNLAGHRFPTDDPLRGVLIRAAVAISETESISKTVALERVVDSVTYKETADTTLAPGETRVVRIELPGMARHLRAHVSAEWVPLLHAQPTVRATRPQTFVLFDETVP